jgi:hypothetical protein
MEMDLGRARDEILSQKAALERAWNEEKDLKRMISDMTAEQGDLMARLDEDKALSKGLDEIRQVGALSPPFGPATFVVCHLLAASRAVDQG